MEEKKNSFFSFSLDLAQKSLKMNQSLFIEDSSQMAKSLNNLGAKYLILEKYKKAIEYFEKSYEIRVRLHKEGLYDDKSMVLIPYLNKANCLEKLGGEENDQMAYEIACYVKKERVALNLKETNNHMIQVNELLEKLKKKGFPKK